MTFSLVKTSEQQLYRTTIKIDGPVISSNLTLIVVVFFSFVCVRFIIIVGNNEKKIINVTNPAPVHDFLMTQAMNVVVMC